MMQRFRHIHNFDNTGNIVIFPDRPVERKLSSVRPLWEEQPCLTSLPTLWRRWRRERRDWQALRRMDPAGLADIGLSPLTLHRAGPPSLARLLAVFLRQRRSFTLRSERNRHVCC